MLLRCYDAIIRYVSGSTAVRNQAASIAPNAAAAAAAIATAAGGAVKAIKTTPLMTTEEGMEAMRQAATLGYRPPG